jgi:hypothetical protein
VRDRPARIPADEAQPFLEVDAVDFVNDAVDIIIEFGAPLRDAAVKRDQFLDLPA